MIKKCLFPAAGYGTRFLPATKAMPKEMLPIVNKPLIQYGVEEALQAGCNQIAIITGRNKRNIEDHFDISYELEDNIKGTDKENYLLGIRKIMQNCSFSYTRQNEMKGLGHAILTGETLIGNEAFGVILADDLCSSTKSVLAQMIEVYEKYQCAIVAIERVDRTQIDKYGIIEGEEIEKGVFQVRKMIEKPSPEEAPSNLAIIGRYILIPEIFDILKQTQPGKKGEIQITDALQVLAQQGKVIAYEFEGIRYDCGSVEGFIQATNAFYKNMQ
ncbi:UTP--glucose-1-phosphate uridylyltransferase [Helicobacter enhydrae]|uniref:UTP--glucose-1-phosphate uridylyltransferase n=1 Tax=Helicobacter enhydrae TaxID=222136 RepID=A0A1B1U6R6_9HELI|nr:UTP--glucose-1-phosphate uridylyltransferase GalU [Helicobacter enhydrae]ANV98440.1 UTP--glucose-1-phosphate uridylyltransferase [Helicobacter enhydrae]